MSERSVWGDLVGQSRVAGYLSAAVERGAVSHAYLFVGPAGAGKKSAARALACAVICPDRGCGRCEACRRVKRGVHADVREVAPLGAATYVVDQIREVIYDVNLAPMEGERTIYIIEAADSFNEAAANAFLKTLEEPPAHVIIVLLATSYETVLPTIASRCQVVRFRRMESDEAVRLLIEKTGASQREAVAALAATGGVLVRAREFLNSPPRRLARDHMLATLKDLPVFDEHDTLRAARDLLAAVKVPLDEIKALQAAEVRERTEFVGGSAGKELAERHKRQLTAREREGVVEVLNIAESWLRDCLVLSQDVGDLVANWDAVDAMEEVAAVMTPAAAVRTSMPRGFARRSATAASAAAWSIGRSPASSEPLSR